MSFTYRDNVLSCAITNTGGLFALKSATLLEARVFVFLDVLDAALPVSSRDRAFNRDQLDVRRNCMGAESFVDLSYVHNRV